MSMAEEIVKLNRLKDAGAISEQEYLEARKALFDGGKDSGVPAGEAFKGVKLDENAWAMFIHLSQLCGLVMPLAGLVVPIVLWQLKKTEFPALDQHGRVVANWIITMMIFGVAFSLLSVFVIGVPPLIILLLLGVIFPIIGGVKANKGELWPYPFSIKFFPLDSLATTGAEKIQ